MTVYVPFDGVIKQLMYEEGAIATKGMPLLMVEVEGEAEGWPKNFFSDITQNN